MADYYLRHGEYPVYAAVPTGASWPLDAQDGDGLGTDIAVPAIASIDFTGAASVAGELIAIMGATLTCAASPAVNQFGVLTGAALATSVAGAINAATNTVNSGTTAALAQLRDMCYARVNPLNTAMVQIMTRPGSATLNHAGNSNVAITETMAANPVIVQFAGGVSGAWGYLWNAPPEGTASTATIWPSAKAINTYGVAFLAAANRSLVGPVLTFDDAVNQRGSNAVLSSGTSTGTTTIFITSLLNLLVDDGGIWAGSTGTFSFKHEKTSSAHFMVQSSVATGRPVSLACKTKDKLIFNFAAVAGTSGGFHIGTSTVSDAQMEVRNASVIDNCAAAAGVNSRIIFFTQAAFMLRFTDCTFTFTRSGFYPLAVPTSNSRGYFEASGCTFIWTALASGAGVLFDAVSLTNQTAVLNVRNCEAIGATPRIFSISSNQLNVTMLAKNMAGFDLSTTLSGYLANTSDIRPEMGYCLMQNVGAGRAMRLETNTAVLDWNPAGGYPTLNSALPSGLPWSYRLLLSASENATRYGANVELLSLTKTFEHTADAVATLTLELAVISTYAASITTGHLALLIAYTDTAGLQQLEKANWSITPRAETTALTSSAAAWTLNDYGSHVAKKIAHTTGYAVKRNTEIEVSLMLRRVMPEQVEIFVDPDIAVAV